VKYIKIYIYFGINIFLLVMGWIVFYRLKLMKDSMEYWDPSGQAGLAYDRVTSSVSILLIVTFMMISLLIWREFWILHSKKINQASENSGSDSLKPELQKTSEISDAQSAEESEKEKYEVKRSILQNCFEKEIFRHSGESENIIGEKILSCISKVYEITQAEVFLKAGKTKKNTKFRLLAAYAIPVSEEYPKEFDLGEGLIGQVARSGKHHYIDKLPEGYLNVRSGLGQSDPNCLLIFPWKDTDGETFAVVELASFKPFSHRDIELLESFSENFNPFFNLV
jgi:hypothetical protein